MLTFSRIADPRRGIPRRVFLQAGLAAPLGLATTALASSEQPSTFGRAKRCILVYLNGGPSQLDTWDMKPDAPADIRGELKPIATSVPGIQTSELYPLIAAQADKFKIVRSVTHNAPVHTTAVYTMLTGTFHRSPAVDQTRIEPQDHPHLGSIYAKSRGWSDRMPPFVCLPTLFRAPPVDGVWAGQTAGFLGRRYDPLVIEGDKQTARFRLPEVELPATLTAERVASRRALLSDLDRVTKTAQESRRTAEKDAVFDQAWSLLDSVGLRRAVDLDREPAAVRERYGKHLFGQGLLLARRLSEAGVPLVTVYWIDPTPAGDGGGEYDSHGRIYWHMRNRLAEPTDRALSALFIDLWQRGLHKDTLLVVMSEFGRTPRINKDAGRDHWPDAQSILLAGAGISGGAIHGATDKHAAYPITDPVTPPDLGQTILHMLGVPAHYELRDPQGRPILASPGDANHKLMS